MSTWRPPERIRHSPAGGAWPSASEAARSRLFSNIDVGSTTLRQRTWVPAMVPWRAGEDGGVTPDVLAWYRRFGVGRPGALVVEATGIRDVPSGPLLRIGDDRFVAGLRALTESVREASGGDTRLFIQLIDFLSIRRRPDPARFLAHFLVVTDSHRQSYGSTAATDAEIREWLGGLAVGELERVLSGREFEALQFGARERVTDTHLTHIRDLPRTLPRLFADAARRAREAGFDGVELHFAHAYTLASFMSRTNDRSDGYGSSCAGRLRLPLEVYHAVRSAVGADFVIGCRFLAEECIDGGSDATDAAYFGAELAAAGLDFLSLSRGGKFDDARQPKIGEAAYPYTGRSGYECMPSYFSDSLGPFGRNLSATAVVRAAVRERGLSTPVVAAGGIHSFEQAERVLADGHADIVAFARQALADPDWFEKVRTGHGAQVRLCLYTNYCEALDQRHRQVTCELWDREGLEVPGVMLSSDGKRRLLPPPWDPRTPREP
jgi:dimethylglycine catabolism A